jgi:hypothetical protein
MCVSVGENGGVTFIVFGCFTGDALEMTSDEKFTHRKVLNFIDMGQNYFGINSS